MSTPDDAVTVVRPEPWTTVVARYAANVLGLVGVGAILNVVLGQFWEPKDWAGLWAFALLAGAWSTWLEQGSASREHQGRRLAAIVASALAIYVLTLIVADAADFTRPAPSGMGSLVFGLIAMVGSLVVFAGLEADEV